MRYQFEKRFQSYILPKLFTILLFVGELAVKHPLFSVNGDLIYCFLFELHFGTKYISYDQRKHYLRKEKLENIGVNKVKVQNTFYAIASQFS